MVSKAQQLSLKKKTGFVNLQPERPVIIRDMRGKIFYSTEMLEQEIKKFNMPPGNYQLISGVIAPMKEPVKFPLSVIPRPERNYPNPFDFKIVFGFNPNKCSIIWRKKTILFDDKLKSKTEPELYFILFHEFGHKLYKTEKYADLYASNAMLLKGFNNSQIGNAPITSLSSGQWDRKKYLTGRILNRMKHKRKRI